MPRRFSIFLALSIFLFVGVLPAAGKYLLPSSLSDDTGKVIARAEYSAYGLIAMRDGDLETPFLYNGQAGVQTDPNGLLNMRARYYSPYLMRFLNADPIGFSGGSNWFAYANGNPISMSDPFGLCAESGGTWQSIKDGFVNFIGGTLDGWALQDLELQAGAERYDNWYNQQTPFVQNAEMARYIGLPPEYITNFSEHKGEALVLGTAAILSGGRIRGGPLAAKTAAGAGDEMLDVYRVFGGDARAQGFSWTTVDPRTVSNFRNAAGLPSGGASGATNTADFLIQGQARASDIIKSRAALRLDGNVGGLPELIIDPKNVKLFDFSILNP